jgi:putative flippase GtrA
VNLSINPASWWALPQQLRFLIAGGFNTALGYGIFAALYWLLGRRFGYLAVAVLAYVISVICAFCVYRFGVFRSPASLSRSFVRFNLSQLIALGLGLVGLYTLVEFAHLNPLLAQACVIVVSALTTYLLHSRFSFRAGRRDN